MCNRDGFNATLSYARMFLAVYLVPAWVGGLALAGWTFWQGLQSNNHWMMLGGVALLLAGPCGVGMALFMFSVPFALVSSVAFFLLAPVGWAIEGDGEQATLALLLRGALASLAGYLVLGLPASGFLLWMAHGLAAAALFMRFEEPMLEEEEEASARAP